MSKESGIKEERVVRARSVAFGIGDSNTRQMVLLEHSEVSTYKYINDKSF